MLFMLLSKHRATQEAMMFNPNPLTLIPTEYLEILLRTADTDRYDIEDELARRSLVDSTEN